MLSRHKSIRHSTIRNVSRQGERVHAQSLALPVSRLKGHACWLLVLVVWSLLLVNPALAQSRLSEAGEGPAHAFTLNPFFVLAGWISGEYEQRVNSSLTLGAGASYVDFSDQRYTSFEMKARLYPNEKALRGFEMGLGLGVTPVDPDTMTKTATRGLASDRKNHAHHATVILMSGHQWNLGENRPHHFGIGGRWQAGSRLKKRSQRHTSVIPFSMCCHWLMAGNALRDGHQRCAKGPTWRRPFCTPRTTPQLTGGRAHFGFIPGAAQMV